MNFARVSITDDLACAVHVVTSGFRDGGDLAGRNSKWSSWNPRPKPGMTAVPPEIIESKVMLLAGTLLQCLDRATRDSRQAHIVRAG